MSEPMSITIAGNIIVDNVKMVPTYPKKLSLVAIEGVEPPSLGGLLANVAADMATLDPNLRIHAIGHVGTDAAGELAMRRLGSHPGIDLSGIRRHEDAHTAFTDVMTVSGTGERTFFTYNGANDLLCDEDFDFTGMSGLLHIGYILLLPGLDAPDEEYGTKMARVLARAQEAGLITSVDVVSEDSDRFAQKVLPALPHTDYLSINENEAQQTTGIQLRAEDGSLLKEGMPQALQALRKSGVRKWITIHAPEGAFGLDENDEYHAACSEEFPPGHIKSSVGAGDAFTAAMLLAILKGEDFPRALAMANTVAGMSLAGVANCDGLGTWEEAEELLAERASREANE